MSSFTLSSGSSIPSCGLGCWMGSPVTPGSSANEETYDMVLEAIKAGYRHFDTAAGYGNEEAVGKAIRDSGLKREEVFVTTKIGQGDHARVKEALQEALNRFGLSYVDLLLVHWPQATDQDGNVLRPNEFPTVNDTWSQMESLLDDSTPLPLARNIGVSNFSIPVLKRLLDQAKIKPNVNQIERHPYLPQHELLETCKSKSVHVTAYSPLGQGNSPILSDDKVIRIAERKGCKTSQVVLAWNIASGVSVVPKSANPQRLAENLAASKVKLTAEEIAELNELWKEEGKWKSLCQFKPAKTKDGVFGWSWEELGWEAQPYLHDL